MEAVSCEVRLKSWAYYCSVTSIYANWEKRLFISELSELSLYNIKFYKFICNPLIPLIIAPFGDLDTFGGLRNLFNIIIS